MTDPKPANASYEGAKALSDYITGNSLEHSITTESALRTIKLFSDFEANKNEMPDYLRSAYEWEAKWFSRSAKAIAGDATLAQRFGQGIDGIIALSAILKRSHNDAISRAVLEKHAVQPEDLQKVKSSQSAFEAAAE
jgi:hypothetical protein